MSSRVIQRSSSCQAIVARTVETSAGLTFLSQCRITGPRGNAVEVDVEHGTARCASTSPQ